MPRASAALERLLLWRLRTLRMKFFSNSFTASSKRIPRVIIWSRIDSCATDAILYSQSSIFDPLSSILYLRSPILKIVAGEQAICFEILLAGYPRNFRGKRGRGRSFVPIECLKVIAHKLLIERRLRSSRGVGVSRPESG